MINKHQLHHKKYKSFLRENRQDPITGDTIQENDTVVICAVCKSAFLEDSWSYMNGQHCNQSSTLKKIPKENALIIKQEKTKPKKANKQKNTERNEKYRSISLSLAVILPIGFYVFCMVNYFKPTDTGFLMTGVFLTAGISGVLIMFVDYFFKNIT
ncbi:hypothetical protein WAF17_11635 [Bernardetia sp. ABR2-2B]|uniref:hypothetical protein n=1 Tax=Bernardetia sp. ABR2-2B TaxID=3127472 RepID=UPI0030CB27CC